MNIKKILSSALIVVMLLTSLLAVIPMNALAAEASAPVVTVKTDDDTTEDQIKKIANEYLASTYANAREMLEADLGKGYLDSIISPKFEIYVNRYTGVAYYVNKTTGQILTTNPIDPGHTTTDLDRTVLSQVELVYFNSSSPEKTVTYNSFDWITQGSIISLSKTEDGKGIAVDYVLGEAVSSLIAPGAIMASTLHEDIAVPLFAEFARILEEACGAFPTDGSVKMTVSEHGGKVALESYNLGDENNNKYLRSPKYADNEYEKTYVAKGLSALVDYAKDVLGTKHEDYKKISEFSRHARNIFNAYQVYCVAVEKDQAIIDLWYETVPAMADEGESAFVLSKDATLTDRRLLDRAFKFCLPAFTTDDVKACEDECRYVNAGVAVPAFKCKVIYYLADDGSLMVDFPANAIDYDESEFTLKSITPIKYFGCGDMEKDGYVFFPDGSGTIIQFKDFYSATNKIAVNVTSKVYGQDFCYANITGKRREQITMPVYGIVNEAPATPETQLITGKDTVTSGFFAILEEGASLAELGVTSGGGTHKYAFSYASYTPYPSDEYKLSEALSVGSGSYFIVSDSKYEGSYKTRITMLTDESVAKALNMTSYYETGYVGMAACYRDYLKEKGVLEALETVSDDIPLYIEALGSMDVTKKILTFPVTVSIPLTSFDDVKMMYDELSDAINKLKAKADEYEKLADDLEAADTYGKETTQIARYREKAANYLRLSNEVVNIRNINFKLTGFANGGMYFTYPAKVWWENSLGGKHGFTTLVEYAKSIEKDNANSVFGIYPDFDFMFINNTALFDGISTDSAGAKMVDNRYASKQVYDSITGSYEKLFAIVVSPDALGWLYDKFNWDYQSFGATGLSVSTLGSVLNSNFDDDNPINREQALSHVVTLLDKMANEHNYTLLTDIGNIYAAEFVDHVVNANIDSSHFVYSSYAIPFYGMVLHGYVSYAGSPINYSGSPDYELLRSIESGATLYYILCTQNANHLKEDEMLSKYYGVDYANWFDKIVEQYAFLNDAIGGLQKYEIVYHSTILSERIIDADEMAANYVRLIKEFIEIVDRDLSDLADKTLEEMRQDDANIGKGLEINIDKASIVAYAEEILGLTEEELSDNNFETMLDEVIAKYEAEYPAKTGATVVSFDSSNIVYESSYAYVTDSVANAENYERTDFTCDNGNVVMVTYKNPTDGKTVTFILNYNIFDVEVKVDNTIDPSLADGEIKSYSLGKLDFVKIENNQ